MARKTEGQNMAKSSSRSGDARFANFQSDPRFALPSKKSTRTKIDKRFSRMLKDEDFTKSAKVDRYGRKLKSGNKAKALRNLYEAESDEEEEDGIDEVDDDRIVQRELKKANANYDPARGGGFSSSSESDSDSESEKEEAVDEESNALGKAGSMQRLHEAQADVEVGEITKRIAIVNLDWDNIKSPDLLALMSSFVPKGGRIDRVSIYPSEFGKERMQREELEGPPKEIFKQRASSDEESSEDDSEDSTDEEEAENIKKDLLQEGDDQDFDSDALRSYQLDRLRYYYAIVLCSDESTAEQIYKNVDGTEYQTSSNFMDLRFVPDEVTFDDEARDECSSVPPDYRPAEFITDALQHSKVKLTWDMHPDDASRRENIKRAFSGSRTELEENDMKAYLASSDSEDADDQELENSATGEPKSKKELARQKMREALGLGSDTVIKSSKLEPVGEMEMTFNPDDDDENGSGKRLKSPDREETTVEKYMRKEREKKARKKEKALVKRDGASNAADEDSDEGNEDLGFDDPFFTTEEPAKPTKSTMRKEERVEKRQRKEADAKKNAEEKAQLEKIMADDSKDVADHLDHFDMNEIARAEKQKFKRGKHNKKGITDRGGMQEGFEMNVDERFQAVFGSHEFAIDPSNPKFKSTPGMKQLLEESRKKRKHSDGTSSGDKKKARRR